MVDFLALDARLGEGEMDVAEALRLDVLAGDLPRDVGLAEGDSGSLRLEVVVLVDDFPRNFEGCLGEGDSLDSVVEPGDSMVTWRL